jgi:hypothetical protein
MKIDENADPKKKTVFSIYHNLKIIASKILKNQGRHRHCWIQSSISGSLRICIKSDSNRQKMQIHM